MSQPGSGRDIGHGRDFQVAFVHADQFQRFPNDRVLDLLDRGRFLQLGVLQKKPIHETSMNVDIDMLVDRRGDEKSAVLAIIRRQIGAAAAERNSQRRTRDDHPGIPSVEKLSQLVQGRGYDNFEC